MVRERNPLALDRFFFNLIPLVFYSCSETISSWQTTQSFSYKKIFHRNCIFLLIPELPQEKERFSLFLRFPGSRVSADFLSQCNRETHKEKRKRGEAHGEDAEL